MERTELKLEEVRNAKVSELAGLAEELTGHEMELVELFEKLSWKIAEVYDVELEDLKDL